MTAPSGQERKRGPRVASAGRRPETASFTAAHSPEPPGKTAALSLYNAASHGAPVLLGSHGDTEESPVVLNVYRGGWCPYCNLEMKALHDALPQIDASGARLVGTAPETPDNAMATAERHPIHIDILSDAGNRVAERLGLVFELPEALRPI